jgi:Phytanoyl-CoA dioxygenase (PhyH)
MTYAGEVGIAVLTGVLGRDEVNRVRQAVWHTVESERVAAVHNIHRSDLVMTDAIYRGLLEHPVALRFATSLLGQKIRLSDFSATITGPGSGTTPMLAGQGYVTAPWPAWPLAVSIVWVIDAFTAENGAIRVMPDSLRYQNGPESGLDYPEAMPLVCPAGSIIVMDGRIWRQTGPNTTTSAHRIGLCADYIRPWILPQIDWPERVPPAVRETLTPGLHEILGFGSRATRHLQTRHGRQMWLDDPALGE